MQALYQLSYVPIRLSVAFIIGPVGQVREAMQS